MRKIRSFSFGSSLDKKRDLTLHTAIGAILGVVFLRPVTAQVAFHLSSALSAEFSHTFGQIQGDYDGPF
jgi:hypothetical protein